MGPRLASLALLLLALCRTSTADTLIPAGTMAKQTLHDKLAVDAAQKEATEKLLSEMPGLFKAMEAAISGNAIEDEKLKKIIGNEVMCALEDTTLEPQFKKARYGTQVDAAKDEAFAFAHLGVIKETAPKTTCTTAVDTPEWKCFCTDHKVAYYCLLEKYKTKFTPTKTKCAKDLLGTIKTSSSLLAVFLDVGAAAEPPLKTKIDAILNSADVAALTQAQDEVMAKFYCAAIEPTVVSTVDELISADYVHVLVAAMLNDAKATTCADEKLKATTLGKCLCTASKGHFCYIHAFGKFFEEDGYLSCSGDEKKFDKTKQPAAIDVTRAPRDAPAVTTEAATNATTAAPKPDKDAAATSTVLLGTLSAAAAMLLRD